MLNRLVQTVSRQNVTSVNVKDDKSDWIKPMIASLKLFALIEQFIDWFPLKTTHLRFIQSVVGISRTIPFVTDSQDYIALPA